MTSSTHPLSGCTIAFSGTFGDTHKFLGNYINALGGSFTDKIDSACTHLIVTKEHFQSRALKVRQAEQRPGLKIVTFEWLKETRKKNIRADDDDYEIRRDQPSKGLKRARSVTPVRETSRPDSPICQLPDSIQQLVEFIFDKEHFKNVMYQFTFDLHKLRLESVDKIFLMRGYEALGRVVSALPNQSATNDQEFDQAVREFFEVIPHQRRQPWPYRPSDVNLMREYALLEALNNMEIAYGVMKEAKVDEEAGLHRLDCLYHRLGLREMTPVNRLENEFIMLKDYFLKSHYGHRHEFRVHDIFRIERYGENERFSKSAYANIEGDRRLLWHCSPATDYVSLLHHGVPVVSPDSPTTRHNFGRGIYLTDVSLFSHCRAEILENVALLLICDAELGKSKFEQIAPNSSAHDEGKEKGHIATWGKGRWRPDGWKDAGCVHTSLQGVLMPDTSKPYSLTNDKSSILGYNQYVVHNPIQVRVRYLLRVQSYNPIPSDPPSKKRRIRRSS